MKTTKIPLDELRQIVAEIERIGRSTSEAQKTVSDLQDRAMQLRDRTLQACALVGDQLDNIMNTVDEHAEGSLLARDVRAAYESASEWLAWPQHGPDANAE